MTLRRTYSSIVKAALAGDTPRAGETLTESEASIMEHLYAQIRANGYQPSLREIGDAIGYIHPSSVMYHVRNLYAKGYLAPQGNSGRSRNTVLILRPDGRPFTGFVDKGDAT
jgi:DNA-binding MarR family transcriptional regulator